MCPLACVLGLSSSTEKGPPSVMEAGDGSGRGGAGSGSAVSRVRPLPSCAVVSRLHVGAVTVPALPVATGLSEKMQWSSGNSGLQTAVMTAGDGAGGALARWQWHS